MTKKVNASKTRKKAPAETKSRITYVKKAKRVPPGISYEREAGFQNQIVVGVDEVGRGCLAGPVVAAAVILPSDPAQYDKRKISWLRKVTDSKLVDHETRAELAPLIKSWARGWAIAQADVSEIDRINIHHASHLAMCRAIEGVEKQGDFRVAHVLVDGKYVPKGLPCATTAIIKGDSKCLSIACASIIAKVFRDEMMKDYDKLYPGFGFGIHKGYSTPMHAEAIKRQGICEIHRRSFAPVAVVAAALLQIPLPLEVSQVTPSLDDVSAPDSETQ
jgi:ribonuclease HII